MIGGGRIERSETVRLLRRRSAEGGVFSLFLRVLRAALLREDEGGPAVRARALPPRIMRRRPLAPVIGMSTIGTLVLLMVTLSSVVVPAWMATALKGFAGRT